MKRIFLAAGILCFTLAGAMPVTFAGGHCGRGDMPPYQKDYKDGLAEKFEHKAHFLKSHGQEAGLSEEQIDAVKDLWLKTKQDLIRQDAEIEIVKLEIEHALHQNPMNVPQINKEIDSKYDLKKARAKSLVAAYAKLKAIPTEEQWENLKVFWKDKK